MPDNWSKLGEGTYNTTYVNKDKTLVLKIPKIIEHKKIHNGSIITTENKPGDTEHPERAVRIWNEINPHIEPKAYVITTELGSGWICPFIEGEQSSDKEMSLALIAIYNRTGRIVIDAIAKRNFITTSTNEMICVDIGFALQLQKQEELLIENLIKKRRRSLTSMDAWQALQNKYQKFFQAEANKYPDTIETVKSLLFIQHNRPDILNVDFLNNNSDLLTMLSKAYDSQYKIEPYSYKTDIQMALAKIPIQIPKEPSIAETPKCEEASVALEELTQEQPLDFTQIKDSCIKQLLRYIRSRGQIDKKNHFKPNWITRLFRSKRLTQDKVDMARQLIKDVKKSISPDEITQLLHATLEDERTSKAKFNSHLVSKIVQCLVIINKAKNPVQSYSQIWCLESSRRPS